MAAKVFVCAVALIIQNISAQAIGSIYGPGMIGSNYAAIETAAAVSGLPYAANAFACDGIPDPILSRGFGLALADLAANGGGFVVSSSSPFAPNGVSVQSEDLVFEGPLAVIGKMPFLGSVGLEGPLPATGQGAVAYGCGTGDVGILSEEFPAIAANAAINFVGPMGPPNPNVGGYNHMGPYGPYGYPY